MRIVEGSSASNGRVEVYISSNSRWSTVCDDDWDIRDADVVCRQLGYPRALAAASGNTFPMGNGSILLTGAECTGNEESLLECAEQTASAPCNHMEDAGVYCFGEFETETSGCKITAPPSGSIAVRISLGNNGLVTIEYSNELKPICADGWDNTAADVTCRQLGFARAASITTIPGEAGTLAWLSDIRCNGDETALSYCRHSGFVRQNCPTNRFAGVSCSK